MVTKLLAFRLSIPNIDFHLDIFTSVSLNWTRKRCPCCNYFFLILFCTSESQKEKSIQGRVTFERKPFFFFTIKQRALHRRLALSVSEAATPGSRTATVAAVETWRRLVCARRLMPWSLTIDFTFDTVLERDGASAEDGRFLLRVDLNEVPDGVWRIGS